MVIKTARLKKTHQSHTTLRPGGNRSRQVLCTSPPRLCRWFPEWQGLLWSAAHCCWGTQWETSGNRRRNTRVTSTIYPGAGHFSLTLDSSPRTEMQMHNGTIWLSPGPRRRGARHFANGPCPPSISCACRTLGDPWSTVNRPVHTKGQVKSSSDILFMSFVYQDFCSS